MRARTRNKFIGSVDHVTLHILRVVRNTKLPVVFALLLCEGMLPFVDNFDIGTYMRLVLCFFTLHVDNCF